MKIFIASSAFGEKIKVTKKLRAALPTEARMDGGTAWREKWVKTKGPNRRLFSYANIIFNDYWCGVVFNQTLRRIDNAR